MGFDTVGRVSCTPGIRSANDRCEKEKRIGDATAASGKTTRRLSRRKKLRGIERFEASGEDIGEKVYEEFRFATVGIFFGIKFNHIDREKIFRGGENAKSFAHFVEAEATGAWNRHGAKIFRGDHVGVKVQDKLARLGVQMVKRFLRRFRRASGLDIDSQDSADGRPVQKFLLGR